MHPKALSTITTWTCLIALATSSPFFTERKGKYTLYRRDPSVLDSLVTRDDASFFPFPANQSSIIDAGSEPTDLPPGDLTVDDYAASTDGSIPRKFIETKCDAGKKFKITNAWKEANLLAKAQTTFNLGYNYNIPHTQWLGPDWNSESSWIPWKYNYRKLIGDNLGRLSKLYGNNAPKHDYIYWYCYDYGNTCTEGVQAYSWDSPGLFWSNHYTVFCDPFYDRSTLGDQIAKYANNKNEQKVMENFHLSRGQIMFHETWHYKTLVSSPRTDDYAYQAQGVWDLAKNKGTSYAYVNADSYALDAVAIYVQQHYKSSMSPVPWRELAKLDAEAAGATSQPADDNAKAVTFTDKPPGWAEPLSDTDSPDPSVWEEVHDDGSTSSPEPSGSPTAPSTDAKLKCNGVTTTKWMGRDALNGVIGTFCGDAETQGVQDPGSGSLVRRYNEGGPDAVELSIEWPSGSDFKPKKDDCVGFLTTVMDSCDGDDPDHNPLNWKHGGVNQVGEQQYHVIPLTERYKSGVCAVHVHEKEDFWGVDGPGTARSHSFHLTVDAKDADGKIIGGTDGEEVEAGQSGGNPYVYDGYYAPLKITPEAQGDYVQFAIGSQGWRTTDPEGVPRCETGDWDGDFSPVGRDMDCFFHC